MDAGPQEAQVNSSKLSENKISEDIYKLKLLGTKRTLALFILSFSLFFCLNYPVRESFKSASEKFINSLPGRPLQYALMDISLFPFPTVTLKNVLVTRLFTIPLTLENLSFSVIRPSFYPPGLKLHLQIQDGPSMINIHPAISPWFHKIKIEDTKISSALLSKLTQNKLNILGDLMIEALITVEGQKPTDGNIVITSNNLNIPSQKVSGFIVPALPIETVMISGDFNDKSQLILSQIQLGTPSSPVQIKGQGVITVNPNNTSLSKLAINLKLAFSASFLENFSIIKGLFPSGPDKEGLYNLKLQGTVGAPVPVFQ